jgi:hypothetical protein
MMSEVFWVGFYSSVIGLIVAIMASCYKSKCSKVDVGCIHIERDVEAEEEIDKPQNPISNATL